MASKRRWFQIHLSTAAVLSLVAGLFFWMNSAPRTDENSTIAWHGWPTPFWFVWKFADQYPKSSGPVMNSDFGIIRMNELQLFGVVYDLFALAIILLLTAYVCERLVRRRRPTP